LIHVKSNALLCRRAAARRFLSINTPASITRNPLPVPPPLALSPPEELLVDEEELELETVKPLLEELELLLLELLLEELELLLEELELLEDVDDELLVPSGSQPSVSSVTTHIWSLF